MAEIVAYFQTPSGGPLVGPAGPDIPEVLIVRSPADTVAQASVDMVELVNAPGWYRFAFATVDGEEYVFTADGDPAVTGQVSPTSRFIRGAISGTTVERVEVDVPAILADTTACGYGGAVWINTRGGGAPGAVVGVNGTEGNPVDNEADALTLAAALGVRRFKITGDLEVTQDYDGWTFHGSDNDGGIRFEGFDFTRCVFTLLECRGVMGSSALSRNFFVECSLLLVTDLYAMCRQCQLFMVGILDGQATFFDDCRPFNKNGFALDLGNVTIASTAAYFFSWSGSGLSFSNLTVAGATVQVFMDQGDVVLEASMTDGDIMVGGTGTLDDQSTGSTVVDSTGFVQASRLTDLHRYRALGAGDTRVDTPSSIAAGGITQSVDVAGPVITTTRT